MHPTMAMALDEAAITYNLTRRIKTPFTYSWMRSRMIPDGWSGATVNRAMYAVHLSSLESA